MKKLVKILRKILASIFVVWTHGQVQTAITQDWHKQSQWFLQACILHCRGFHLTYQTCICDVGFDSYEKKTLKKLKFFSHASNRFFAIIQEWHKQSQYFFLFIILEEIGFHLTYKTDVCDVGKVCSAKKNEKNFGIHFHIFSSSSKTAGFRQKVVGTYFFQKKITVILPPFQAWYKLAFRIYVRLNFFHLAKNPFFLLSRAKRWS